MHGINYAPMGHSVNRVSEINLEVIPMDQGIRGCDGLVGLVVQWVHCDNVTEGAM